MITLTQLTFESPTANMFWSDVFIKSSGFSNLIGDIL